MINRKTAGRPAKIHHAFGESKTLREWALDSRFDSPLDTIKSRMRRGLRLEEALNISRRRSTRVAEVASGVNREMLVKRLRARLEVLDVGSEFAISEALGMSRQMLSWRITRSKLTTPNVAFLAGLCFLPAMVLWHGKMKALRDYEHPPQGYLSHLRDLIKDGIEATDEDAYFRALTFGEGT